MFWRIEIHHNPQFFDSIADEVCRNIAGSGLHADIEHVEIIRVYNIYGSFNLKQTQQIASSLLTDPVTQSYECVASTEFEPPTDSSTKHIIEIAYHPGVMDPVEEAVIKGIKDLGFDQIEAVHTAKQYILYGSISPKAIHFTIEKVLSNKLIQLVVDFETYVQNNHHVLEPRPFELVTIDMLKASDKELQKISEKGQLYLSLHEMQCIQKHYRMIGRNPTDCELETIAQTWSEHCYHKTFRGNIDFTYEEKGVQKTKRIKNLLKSTIAKATHELNKDWCISVFHDNAGVVAFDEEDHVCFKVETHNHPSALEPFGGANTGIGGVIRDTLGTGLGAKPICNTDVFCFAPPSMTYDELPPGTLHPRRVMKGVVSGVRDYGNKMGIPTVNGAVLFDRKFVGNPLVYCGNVGIMPREKVFKKVGEGDAVVVAGGRTGRDGIHGATFSSGELTDESEVVSSGAVQIGDPIQEKKVCDALLKARDLNLYSAVTDCGAGGLSSAVGEMGEELGARVDLDKVPLKYQGLLYHEIWISESQERMVFSVPQKNIKKLLKVFAQESVEATVIGEFTGTQRLELYYEGQEVCDLDMHFLHNGNPKVTKKAVWKAPKTRVSKRPKNIDLEARLNACLMHLNVCSKEWIIRQYDHEVQGGSIIKPLVGKETDGPSDAAVVKPKLNSFKGLAVSNGINIRYGMLDPFKMAGACIDEAIRQIVSVGGRPNQIAILDNFCWGNPDKPDRLGSMVRAAQGCYKAAVAYGTPFISGKDSLYNEFTENNKSIAIPGTLLISALGIVDDVRKTITMDFKEPRNYIYVVGDTYDELGGSIYLDTLGELGEHAPDIRPKTANKIYAVMHETIQHGLIRSAHDCSEGGIAVALSEMAFAGGYGAYIETQSIPFKGKEKSDEVILFSESNSRFIVEIDPGCVEEFEEAFKGLPIARVGCVTDDTQLHINGLEQRVILQDIRLLKDAWQYHSRVEMA